MSFSEYNDATFSSAFFEPQQQILGDYIPKPNSLDNSIDLNTNDSSNDSSLSQEDESKIKDILNAATEQRENEIKPSHQISMPPMRMPEHNPILTNSHMQKELLKQLIQESKLLNNQQEAEPEPEQTNKPSLKLMFLSLIIFVSFMIALSWNEAIKYYINRSMKLYEGKPVFFIYYGLCTTALGVSVYCLSKQYI